MFKILMCTFALVALTSDSSGQNKQTIFYDSLGQKTTWENHWAQVVTGRYKSLYDKKANKKTLSRTTLEEFDHEIRKTEKRITKKNNLGTEFPDFDLIDISGARVTKKELIGKVVVLNFWFIGCSPCEMERPSLNNLTKFYVDNEDVIFISFARNTKDELLPFLKDNPVMYNTIPTDKDYIKSSFQINEYPVNIILDKQGKYIFNSSASGIGILEILKAHIEGALKM